MEEKKTLKGFTLVELVIVLAIFSVILALVMSFIDPVSNLMKNTSIRERTAAHTDNISEYVDNSLHYAKYLYVYEGGLFEFGDSTQDASLQEVASDIIKNNLDGAVDKEKNPIKGKVRIMKFNNAQDSNGHAGQISEGVWEFTCGDSTATPAVEPIIKDVGGTAFTPTLNNVLNQEYFENYNYYYSIGYYDFKAYETAESGTFGKQNTHNSRLVQRKDTAGHDMEAKIENFPVNIVAYNKEAGSRFTDTIVDDHGNILEEFTAFKSPSHMSTVSMALVNAINVGKADVVNYYRFDTTDNKFKAISGTLAFSNRKYSGPDDKKEDAFYVAYILPYEINDSVMELG